MSQDIILKRKIETETWLIQGEIAKADSRPEIQCVLQFLHDYPDANSTDCSEHLFGDKIGRRIVAERLLHICELHGLANKSSRNQYRLTESGQIALKEERILVPKDGCWRLCVCYEPLLPHPLLTIDAHKEPSAVSIVLGIKRNELDERKKRIVEVPQLVKDVSGLKLEPIGGGSEVRVDKIESKGELISPQGEPYYIEWNVIDGNVDVKSGKDVISKHRTKPISRQQVLQELLARERLLEQWDEQTETLSVVFQDTAESERINMKRSVSVERPYIKNFGSFAPMELPNISISAATESDARKWAEWRLGKNINMYATSSKYKAWREKALEPFKGWNFTLPDRSELANQLWIKEHQQNQHTWHVIAAHDWNL